MNTHPNFKSDQPDIQTAQDIDDVLGTLFKHQSEFYKHAISPRFRHFFIIDPDLTVDFQKIDRLYHLDFSDTTRRFGPYFTGNRSAYLIARLDGNIYIIAHAFSTLCNRVILGSIIACFEASIFSNVLDYSGFSFLLNISSSLLANDLKVARSCLERYPIASNHPYPLIGNTSIIPIRDVVFNIELMLQEDREYIYQHQYSSDSEEE